MKPAEPVMPYGFRMVGALDTVIAKDQPEYLPLPALIRPNGDVITRWELSDDEIEDVVRSRSVFFTQAAFGQPLQPQLPQTETAFLTAFGYEVPDQIKADLLSYVVKKELLKPIDMILPCPRCGKHHVDAPEPEKGWSNPPHKSHLCHFCGVIFRPADVPTNGVAAITTRGASNTYQGDECQRTEDQSKAIEFADLALYSGSHTFIDNPYYHPFVESAEKAAAYLHSIGLLEQHPTDNTAWRYVGQTEGNAERMKAATSQALITSSAV